jgi:Na+/melibiose symporter-like transporter
MLFLTLGVVYFLVMMYGAFTIRVPPEGWKPEGFDPATLKTKSLVTTANVSAANAIHTPSFWLLWTVLLCNVTAGIGILQQASPMIQDFFREDGTSSVTVAVAGGFVGILSMANMAGRFVWSSTSDVIGRKPIYMLYLGGGMICYTLLALIGATSTALFVLLAVVILSFYGGGFATVPAYLRDLFGHLPGRGDPRPAADRLVGRGRGRAADREPVPRRPGQAGLADRLGLPAGPADHGRGAGGRVRGQPPHPPGA